MVIESTIMALVLFGQFFDDMARIADRHYVRRDILGYDRPSTDGYVVADGDSRKDGDAAADPYVVADGNRFSPFVAGVPFYWISAVAGCIDAYVRTDETVISDSDLCLVKHGEMEIGKETLAHADLLAVIAVERLIDDYLIICYVS